MFKQLWNAFLGGLNDGHDLTEASEAERKARKFETISDIYREKMQQVAKQQRFVFDAVGATVVEVWHGVGIWSIIPKNTAQTKALARQKINHENGDPEARERRAFNGRMERVEALKACDHED